MWKGTGEFTLAKPTTKKSTKVPVTTKTTKTGKAKVTKKDEKTDYEILYFFIGVVLIFITLFIVNRKKDDE